MIFVDSNIPMYLVGAAHPLKARARQHLEALVQSDERLVSDAEVFQEILHRYVAIERRDAIQPAFDVLTALVEEVFPVTRDAVLRAKDIVLGTRALSARDAIHVACMELNSVAKILSFDRGFDSHPGLIRLGG